MRSGVGHTHELWADLIELQERYPVMSWRRKNNGHFYRNKTTAIETDETTRSHPPTHPAYLVATPYNCHHSYIPLPLAVPIVSFPTGTGKVTGIVWARVKDGNQSGTVTGQAQSLQSLRRNPGWYPINGGDRTSEGSETLRRNPGR